MRIHAASWSLIAAVPFGLIGAYVGAGTRAPLLVAIAFALGGFGIVLFVSLAIGSATGSVFSSLYFTRGGSAPAPPGLSLAESLIVRGRLDAAVSELEAASVSHPADATAPLRLARLLRNECGRPEEAVRWYLAAAGRMHADPAGASAVLREIFEIHTHVLREPRRALPYLARLVDTCPDTPAAAWARREMSAIRAGMGEDS
jgi:hypothetical protein